MPFLHACKTPLLVLVLLAWSVAARAETTLYPLIITTTNGTRHFQVELARAPQEQERGLMFRKSLDADKGMLFVFPETRPLSFWMKNTLIPLDMLFVDETRRIVSVHANAVPRDETAIPSVGPVRMVLEIAGGQAEKQHIQPGDKIDFIAPDLNPGE